MPKELENTVWVSKSKRQGLHKTYNKAAISSTFGMEQQA